MASLSCEHVKLVEKISKAEIFETGLIKAAEKQNKLIKSLKPKLEANLSTFVYVSKKHGSGAGKYSVSKTTAIDKNIEVGLLFEVGALEAGVSVLNQRVMFLQVQSNRRGHGRKTRLIANQQFIFSTEVGNGRARHCRVEIVKVTHWELMTLLEIRSPIEPTPKNLLISPRVNHDGQLDYRVTT